MRIAILDDYQNIALGLADWASIGADAEITVFNEHMGDKETVAAALADFDVVVAMRERTPFSANLLKRLTKLKLLVSTGAQPFDRSRSGGRPGHYRWRNTVNSIPANGIRLGLDSGDR